MDWGECGLGRCAIVGRIPYWGCKSNLCGADLEGGGASNLTGADRGRMWIGAVSPASITAHLSINQRKSNFRRVSILQSQRQCLRLLLPSGGYVKLLP